MTPRVGVPHFPGTPSRYPDAVRETGGEPVLLDLPAARPAGGVALTREWVSDVAQVLGAASNLEALILDAGRPEELVGILVAAIRLGLPAVAPYQERSTLTVALSAAGFVPLHHDAPEVAVEVANTGEPAARALATTFGLANALRAGLAAGAGPALVVHLFALAREAGVGGFSRMVRVLVPESPAIANLRWLRELGAAALLACLGDKLHDVPTVAGDLKKQLSTAPPASGKPGPLLTFVEGRASGTEALCRAPAEVEEVAGVCRVFSADEKAARAVSDGTVEPGEIVVVCGGGSWGGPGLLELTVLREALKGAGLEGRVAVFTDGLAPEEAGGAWVSLVTPEAAADGIVGRLQDGDALRVDLREGRIRAGVRPEELKSREPQKLPETDASGYAARYARSALPGLEGGGFPEA